MATTLLPGVGYVQSTVAGTFLLPARGYLQEDSDAVSGTAALSITPVTVGGTGSVAGSLQSFLLPGYGIAQEGSSAVKLLPPYGYLQEALGNVKGLSRAPTFTQVVVAATGTVAGAASGSLLPGLGYVQQTSDNSNLYPGYGYIRENITGGIRGNGAVPITQAVVAAAGRVVGGNVSGHAAISIRQAVAAAAGTQVIDDRGTPPGISITVSVIAGGQEITIDGSGRISLPSASLAAHGSTPVSLVFPSILVAARGGVNVAIGSLASLGGSKPKKKIRGPYSDPEIYQQYIERCIAERSVPRENVEAAILKEALVDQVEQRRSEAEDVQYATLVSENQILARLIETETARLNLQALRARQGQIAKQLADIEEEEIRQLLMVWEEM